MCFIRELLFRRSEGPVPRARAGTCYQPPVIGNLAAEFPGSVAVLWRSTASARKVKPQSNVTVGADVTIKLDAAMFQERCVVKHAKLYSRTICSTTSSQHSGWNFVVTMH